MLQVDNLRLFVINEHLEFVKLGSLGHELTRVPDDAHKHAVSDVRLELDSEFDLRASVHLPVSCEFRLDHIQLVRSQLRQHIYFLLVNQVPTYHLRDFQLLLRSKGNSRWILNSFDDDKAPVIRLFTPLVKPRQHQRRALYFTRDLAFFVPTCDQITQYLDTRRHLDLDSIHFSPLPRFEEHSQTRGRPQNR
jgi:hypothetical protein